MIYQNAEIHNVAELLEGTGPEIITPESFEWMRSSGRGAWADAYAAVGSEGRWLTRYPDAIRRTLSPVGALSVLAPAGTELRFNLKGGDARIVLQSPIWPAVAEVYQGGFFMSWHPVGAEPSTVIVKLPKVEKLAQASKDRPGAFDVGLTRVVLPYVSTVKLRSIEGDLAPPRPDQAPGRRWLTYGSSITNGASAVRPTGTYAMRAAQLLGVDLLNMAVDGGALLQPEVAEHLAGRRDWDFATIELGGNLVGSIDAPEFGRRIERFLQIIAAKNPTKLIFAVDLYTSLRDFNGRPETAEFRQAARNAIARLGSPKIVHLSGRDLLVNPEGLSSDLVHPSPSGMEEIAQNLARAIRPVREAAAAV